MAMEAEKAMMSASASAPDLDSRDTTWVKSLELQEKMHTVQDWSDIKEARTTLGLNPWRSSKEEDVEGTALAELLGTLTLQKGPVHPASPSATLISRQSLLGKRHTMSEPDLMKQKPSTLIGSAKYSFGPGYQKPRHLKGKLKIPVMEPRDPENVGGNAENPGAGTYEIRHFLGNDCGEAGGGGTGGWMARDHTIFMRVFKDFKGQASPEFFDRLAVLLPEVPRLSIVNHVKWLPNYEEHKMKLEHKIAQFREEKLVTQEMVAQGAQTLSKELMSVLDSNRKQRLTDTRRIRAKIAELHGQADAEQKRWGIKEPNLPIDGFKPLQINHKDGGVIVDSNFRGHPEFKKAPGYTFGASNEIRDVRGKRLSKISHVRSSSHFDNPGPGHYIGYDEQDRIMKRSPAYTMRMKFTGGDPGLPQPDMDAARRQAEMEKRLKRVGARKGEITATLMWNTSDDIELRVVPPGGKAGYTEICNATPQLMRGRLDTARGVGRSSSSASGRPEPVESISWPQYLLGQAPPPKGEYKIYLTVRSKNEDCDCPWLCRILIGTRARWFGGCVRAGGTPTQSIFSFKYDGPVDSSTKIQQDLALTQLVKPAWKVGTEDMEIHGRSEACSNEQNVITDMLSTPPLIGPGRYTHSTCFLSQY